MTAIEEVEASGPGNAVVVCIRSDAVTEVFTAFGRRGLAAEQVAQLAATDTLRYLASDAAVGPCLADQLLLPLALAGAGKFTTSRPTAHATTQATLISRLFGQPVVVQPLDATLWQVSVGADTRRPGLVD
jgi:RNA 3'-terminal phosphate cyclase (ATP)